MVERYLVPEKDVLRAHPELEGDKFMGRNIQVLKNKMGITHPDTLSDIEDLKSMTRLNELQTRKISGFTPDYAGFKAVHKYIFQDVYEWAGKSRAEQVTIDGETFTPEAQKTWTGHGASFAPSTHLETQTPRMVSQHIQKLDQASTGQSLGSAVFAEHAGKIIGDLNFAHPFREGNGRAMRGYLHQLGRHYGIEVYLGGISKGEWIAGSQQAMDGDSRTMSKLIFENSQTMSPQALEKWKSEQGILEGASEKPRRITIDEAIKRFSKDLKTASRDLGRDEQKQVGDKILSGAKSEDVEKLQKRFSDSKEKLTYIQKRDPKLLFKSLKLAGIRALPAPSGQTSYDRVLNMMQTAADTYRAQNTSQKLGQHQGQGQHQAQNQNRSNTRQSPKRDTGPER